MKPQPYLPRHIFLSLNGGHGLQSTIKPASSQAKPASRIHPQPQLWLFKIGLRYFYSEFPNP
jgi:hypothetical protein